MADKVVELTIRGKASYAKILGSPVLNYNKDGKEWKMDLELTTPAAVKEVKAAGIGDRIKQKEEYLDGSPHITLKQAELRKDGTPNKPVTVVDIKGQPWDQNKLIGNGSVVDVKFAVMDFGPGKRKGVYIRGVRVLDLVPYESAVFGAIDEDDEYFPGASDDNPTDEVEEEVVETKAKPGRKKTPVTDTEDLDDDIPF